MQFLLSRLLPIFITLLVFMGIYKISNFRTIARKTLKITNTVRAFLFVAISSAILYFIIVIFSNLVDFNLKNYGGLVSSIVVGFVLATFHELVETEENKK